MESSLNIDGGFTDTLNVTPSLIYKLNLSSLFPPARCVFGGQHIYSFPPDPNLYLYDLQLDKMTVKGGRSIHQNRSASDFPLTHSDSLSFKQEVEILTSLPQYTAISYNPATHFIYRFFVKEIDYKKAGQRYNTYADKDCYLMTLNTDFCVVNEIKIPNRYVYKLLINTPDGIALIAKVSAKSIELENYVYE